MYLVDWLEKCTFGSQHTGSVYLHQPHRTPRPFRLSDCGLDPSGREQGNESRTLKHWPHRQRLKERGGVEAGPG
jgi:hypothetical protein